MDLYIYLTLSLSSPDLTLTNGNNAWHGANVAIKFGSSEVRHNTSGKVMSSCHPSNKLTMETQAVLDYRTLSMSTLSKGTCQY